MTFNQTYATSETNKEIENLRLTQQFEVLQRQHREERTIGGYTRLKRLERAHLQYDLLCTTAPLVAGIGGPVLAAKYASPLPLAIGLGAATVSFVAGKLHARRVLRAEQSSIESRL